MRVFERIIIGVLCLCALVVSQVGCEHPESTSAAARQPPANPEDFANPQSTAPSTPPDSSVSNNPSTDISDPEKVGVCAGEFMWMAIMGKRMNDRDPTPLHAEHAKQSDQAAFWFLSRARELLGDQKAVAISTSTSQLVGERADREGIASVASRLLAQSSECVRIVTRVLPNTKSCFELSSDPNFGLSYDLKCR